MGFESDLSGLLRQVPPIMYIMFFGSLALLVIVIVAIVFDRRRRARQPAAGGGEHYSMSSAYADSDLPDIDSLTVNAAPPAAHGQGGTYALTLTGGERVEAAEVMTVYRDVAEGGLLVQIGAQIYRHPPVTADADFRRRFAATVRDLSSVIAAPAPASSAPPAPAVPMPPATSATGEMAAARTGTPAAGAPLPGDLPKFKLPDVVEPPKRGRRRPASEPIPEINIAQAIEDYLQFKLQSTGRFPNRKIHVRPAVGGGLRIEVDQASYETVGDVLDADVRAFLQEAIEEWQSRQ